MPGVELGCACQHDGSPTKKRLVWLGLFLLLAFGIVAGVTVSATSKKNNNRQAAGATVVYTPPETSNGGTGNGSSSNNDNNSGSNNDVFKFFFNVQEYFVYQTGADYFPPVVASENTVSLDACLDYCAAYSIAYFTATSRQG